MRKLIFLNLCMQYIEGKSGKQCILFPQGLDEINDENNDVRFNDLFAESIDIKLFYKKLFKMFLKELWFLFFSINACCKFILSSYNQPFFTTRFLMPENKTA